jgi:DNA-binding protein YbaB
MALTAIEELLGSEVLSEEVRTSISEAFDKKLEEARKEITGELREEFAQRYDHDKSQIIEAADKMLRDVVVKELTEFNEDKKKVAEERVQYKKAIAEHADVLNKFIMETLKKEIAELRADRQAGEDKMKKLEGFAIEQLTKELNEFHDDKRSLVEQKVKMIKEGKKVIEEARSKFVKQASEKVHDIVSQGFVKELATLKEDIKSARENEFGRKIFETFAGEFMSSYLAEGTEVKKLSKQIEEMQNLLKEAEDKLNEKDVMIAEGKKAVKVMEESTERKEILDELMAPLAKDKREIMSDLLEGVQTDRLQRQFKKYLPSVIKEDAKPTKNIVNETQKTEFTGNKASSDTTNSGGTQAEIINLRKLAGIRN